MKIKQFVFYSLLIFQCSLLAFEPGYPELRKHMPLESYSSPPAFMAVTANSWVLGIGHDLTSDDKYLDYSLPITAKFDDRSEMIRSGWISIIDASGDEWVQDDVATMNSTSIYALTDDVHWKNLDTGTTKLGSELSIERFWVNVIYDDAAMPEEIYIGIYAGRDIVMGTIYNLNIFDDVTPSALILSLSAPEISFESIDDKNVGVSGGEGFESGDFVSTMPHIEVDIDDDDDNVVSWSMQISLGDQVIVSDSESVVTPNTGTTIDFTPSEALSSGLYTLLVQAMNDSNELGEETIDFEVESGVKIKGLISGPLPCNFDDNELTIEYQLSGDADIDLRIYDIAGEQQKRFDISSGSDGATAGFNRLTWDGVNDFNEAVRNGPYVIYMQAKNDKGKATAKSKLLVLR